MIRPSALVAALLLVVAPVAADEGMFPISDLARLNLRAKGLQIAPTAIYNPGQPGLIDAIVQVGGCSGSFVSPEGLLITNHHCAFGAVQAASTKERDYVSAGLLAATRGDEIPARGLTAQITESYKDVSAEVLAVVTPGMDPAERTRAIERRSNEIVLEAEKAHPGKRARVAEMFAGRSYVLFVSASFRDVRLVYVPPRAVGEFGGEDDNWIWPRHTGDFSFLRVYVGPDGAPADHAAANVPYRPKTFLKVQPAGADEGDFVFILGYPGRTFRHRSSHYLAYEQQVRMPYLADFFARQIGIMEEAGRADRAVSLRFDSRIKGFANVMKNYRGKIVGLRRTDLVAKKRVEEASMQQFIEADPARKARYGTLLADLGRVYDEATAAAARELALSTLGPPGSPSVLLNAAMTIHLAASERAKPDVEREARFMDRNFAATRAALERSLAGLHAPTDRRMLQERLEAVLALPAGQRVTELDQWLAGRPLGAALDSAYETTRLGESGVAAGLLAGPADAVTQSTDAFLALARALAPAFQQARQTADRREGTLNRLWADFVEVRSQMQKTDFVPDANGTLRLTYGRIRGYTPADAVAYSPITTVGGVLDKTTGVAPYYDTPQALVERATAKDFGRFAHPRLKDVPVAILYDTDTSGGNSGSPVLNARGELVGVNFDRAWEATINDFAWHTSYSRSIGVDIRYVLWVAQKVSGATNVLDELGVR